MASFKVLMARMATHWQEGQAPEVVTDYPKRRTMLDIKTRIFFNLSQLIRNFLQNTK